MSDKPVVLVIGGGVIGLSCAWRLSAGGFRVSIIERSYCGCGASGASLGALMPAPATKHGPTQMLQRASLWAFPEFIGEVEDESGIHTDYQRCGLLEVIPTRQRRDQAIREAQLACGEWPGRGDAVTMEVIGRDEAARLEPGMQFTEMGARHCRATAQVDVARLLDALRVAFQRRGGVIREGLAVTGLDLHGGRIGGVVCGETTLSADVVLAAAGAWTSTLAPLLQRHAPVRPAKGQALLLEARGRAPSHMIKRGGRYLLPRGDNAILVGSTTEPEAEFDVRPTADGVATLTEAALDLMPSLADAAFVRSWAGLRPEPLARHPLLGPVPEADGLFVATGHYKTGIAMSSLTGRILADLISGRTPPVDVAPFAPGQAATST